MPKKPATSRKRGTQDHAEIHHNRFKSKICLSTAAKKHRSTASTSSEHSHADQSDRSKPIPNSTVCVTNDTKIRLLKITSYVFKLLSILSPELLKHQADHIKLELQQNVEIVFDESVTSTATREKTLTRYALTLLSIFTPDLLRPLSARNIEALLKDNYESVQLPKLKDVLHNLNRRNATQNTVYC